MLHTIYDLGVVRTIFIFALTFFSVNLAFAGPIVIQEVYVDNPNPGQMLIVGKGFGMTPEATLGTYGVLNLTSISNNALIADLPFGIGDGQYLLHVTVPPTGPTATGCETGKPLALVFQYSGSSCASTTNYQNGRFECLGDPAGAQPINIQMTKDATKVDVIPGDESVQLGDSVSFISTGTRLKSETKFDITQGGLVLQSLNIHSSCSKPLNVGDVFGSMTLTNIIPGGSDVSTYRSSSDEFDMVLTNRGGGEI